MKSVEEIKSEIEALPYEEYMKLVHWFSERDWDAWDQQIEADSAAGSLDFLIQEASGEKKSNKLGKL
jgi:hypothetical protein